MSPRTSQIKKAEHTQPEAAADNKQSNVTSAEATASDNAPKPTETKRKSHLRSTPKQSPVTKPVAHSDDAESQQQSTNSAANFVRSAAQQAINATKNKQQDSNIASPSKSPTSNQPDQQDTRIKQEDTNIHANTPLKSAALKQSPDFVPYSEFVQNSPSIAQSPEDSKTSLASASPTDTNKSSNAPKVHALKGLLIRTTMFMLVSIYSRLITNANRNSFDACFLL
jgi:hypothetical protein